MARMVCGTLEFIERHGALLGRCARFGAAKIASERQIESFW
jgi:hypothetical protein